MEQEVQARVTAAEALATERERAQLSSDNHYVVLGLLSESSGEDHSAVSEAAVRRAYVDLARRHHPDKNPHRLQEATEAFRRISAAYETLSTPQLRREYDASLRPQHSSSNSGLHFSFGGVEIHVPEGGSFSFSFAF